MNRTRPVSLATLVLGGMLCFIAGCEPVDSGGGSGAPPASLSDRICYSDLDCTGNACCGMGTNPTHVLDGPDCSAVRCDGSCPADTIQCGRCLVFCRDSHCAAACSR